MGWFPLRILFANTHLRRILPPGWEIRESGERDAVLDHHDQLLKVLSISFLLDPDRHGKQWIKHASNHICVLLRDSREKTLRIIRKLYILSKNLCYELYVICTDRIGA
jgi:hypothetical protein